MRLITRLVFTLALTWFCFAPLGRGQTELLQLLGAPPNDPTMSIPTGFVNLRNGNVHLEIPLKTFVQRNGLKTEVKYVYDSTFYYAAFNNNTFTYYWTIPSTLNAPVGWRLVKSPAASGVTASVDQAGASTPCTVGGQSAYTPITFSNFTFTDAEGTSHPFSFSFDNQWVACAATDTGGNGYSDDGSGYYVNVIYPASNGCCGQNWQVWVWDTHGTLVSSGAGFGNNGPFGSMEDSNGNALGWNYDELGR